MFEPVASVINFPEVEDSINQFWKENDIFQKSIDNRSVENVFTFVDGPPFVSGLPHYGHLTASIAKDLIPRYQTMLGKRVRRVFGWDCHGLPVEEKVNKTLGIRSSYDLETRVGIENYIKTCREYVQNTTSEWRWYIEKIGRWVDMDHAYYTMNIDFMESVIWAFKQIYDKGLIYQGKRVSLFSTDTSTPVSNFEVAMDPDNYRDVEDLSIFVKFELASVPEYLATKITEPRPINLVAWTTTPWSIPDDFALGVNPNFEYSLVLYDNEYLIVADERIEYTFNKTTEELKEDKLEIQKIATFKGSELVGLSYQPLYDFYQSSKNENDYKVYASDSVVLDEGTGVLHIAPAFGEVDFNIGQIYHLSQNSAVDQNGKMLVEPFSGVYIREASSLITEDLASKGRLLRSMKYVHRLPFYRGENPLIYMAQDAYFINIADIKAKMLELNSKINWIPTHIKTGRYQQTIETSPDWCISRNRYWATIMPIWRSDDGDEIVIGSLAEIAELCPDVSVKEIDGKQKYFFKDTQMQLHRDICDQIVLEKSGKKYHRIPEVMDCWLDSGSVPFAEYHFPFENQELYQKSKPADFIVEYTPQVRAWFNVLNRLSTILFDDVAFSNAICYGTIMGTDGRKMSKSFGNFPDPKIVLEKYGADAMRLYTMTSPLMKGEDIIFSEEALAENCRFMLILWNSYKFFIDYASINGWSCCCDTPVDIKEKLTVMDRWILSKLTSLVLSMRQSLDKYDIATAVTEYKNFVTEDLSTWYIRRSRDRVSPANSVEDKKIFLSVLYGNLVTLTKLGAPIVPFISEKIYKNLVDDLSVHLTDYPTGDKSLIDEKLVADMKIVREIVEQTHAKRKEANIKLRQPLAKLTYYAPASLSAELEEVILAEVNIKQIVYTSGQDLSVEIDTEITPELKEEGEARDLIRTIQQMRKDAGLNLSDQIVVTIDSFPDRFKDSIMSQTVAKDIEVGQTLSIRKI